MPKTKRGEEITWKEYFKRWKSGVAGITPLQQVNIQIQSTWITILGISLGIIVCVVGIRNLWWLMIILIGGLGNTLVQLLGAYQRKKMLKQFDAALSQDVKGGENGI